MHFSHFYIPSCSIYIDSAYVRVSEERGSKILLFRKTSQANNSMSHYSLTNTHLSNFSFSSQFKQYFSSYKEVCSRPNISVSNENDSYLNDIQQRRLFKITKLEIRMVSTERRCAD